MNWISNYFKSGSNTDQHHKIWIIHGYPPIAVSLKYVKVHKLLKSTLIKGMLGMKEKYMFDWLNISKNIFQTNLFFSNLRKMTSLYIS